LRVLHATTHEHTGAGRAAARIHAAVAKSGAVSEMVALHGDGRTPGLRLAGGPLRRRLDMLGRSAEQALLSLQKDVEPGYRSLGRAGPGLAAVRAGKPDVVHLHWIPGLLGIADLPRLGCPAVWTFHDQWPLLGAAHYADSARQDAGFLDRWTLRRKQRHWAGFAPVIACPSRWLAGEARASALFGGREVHLLPNPIDTSLYRPQDRAEARRKLSLPQERLLLLFGAWGAASDRRKGFHVLEEALGLLARRGFADRAGLVLFGAEGDARVQGFDTRWMGFVEDEARMSLLYSACDAFALPSLQDNYPNTLVEAMACGLPAVASAVGGVPDLVRDGETGLLVERGDAARLAERLEAVLAGAELRARLGAAARRAVERDCDERRVGARYVALYEQAMAQWRP
jgi:glycosyltransferase involved in cell wall biosynthesis